ncbi:hypothetical protein F5888DRAFT_1130754 [Russula emetica]|nr:hypothetical protein F5888DRAFT_1130754 [Russula emetica]
MMPLTGPALKELFSVLLFVLEYRIVRQLGFIPGGCGQGRVVPETAPGECRAGKVGPAVRDGGRQLAEITKTTLLIGVLWPNPPTRSASIGCRKRKDEQRRAMHPFH